MRLHFDVLGWLHVIWGACGVLAGASLGLLAIGTAFTHTDVASGGRSSEAAVLAFTMFGVGFAGIGAAMIAVGRGLLSRTTGGRTWALLLAAPNLLAVPFGTILGGYTCWALLNDDARRAFGRPPRTPVAAHSADRVP
jgi:hypothetical protein